MFNFFNKAIDPVCKMKINKNNMLYFSKHKGETYYFCSENCENQFNSNPSNYITNNNTTGSCCQGKSSSKSCC